MGEKFNFICIGASSLKMSQWREEIARLSHQDIFSEATPIEAIRLNFNTNMESLTQWQEFSRADTKDLDANESLFVYFNLSNFGTRSMVIGLSALNEFFTEITLSIDVNLIGSSRRDKFFWEKIAFEYCSWTSNMFASMLMACGPELDSMLLNSEIDFSRFTKLWEGDARNWMMVSTSRFTPRVFTSRDYRA